MMHIKYLTLHFCVVDPGLSPSISQSRVKVRPVAARAHPPHHAQGVSHLQRADECALLGVEAVSKVRVGAGGHEVRVAHVRRPAEVVGHHVVHVEAVGRQLARAQVRDPVWRASPLADLVEDDRAFARGVVDGRAAAVRRAVPSEDTRASEKLTPNTKTAVRQSTPSAERADSLR